MEVVEAVVSLYSLPRLVSVPPKVAVAVPEQVSVVGFGLVLAAFPVLGERPAVHAFSVDSEAGVAAGSGFGSEAAAVLLLFVEAESGTGAVAEDWTTVAEAEVATATAPGHQGQGFPSAVSVAADYRCRCGRLVDPGHRRVR